VAAEMPIVFVVMTELYHFTYIAMMIVGYKIDSEHGETLEIVRKLINKSTESELIEQFRCLSEVIESSPIQCSCGFLAFNRDSFLSVSKVNQSLNLNLVTLDLIFSFLLLLSIIYWWLSDLMNKFCCDFF
jgi:hypothetical protein